MSSRTNNAWGSQDDLAKRLRQEEKDFFENGTGAVGQEDRRGRHGKEAWTGEHVFVLRGVPHDLSMA